MSNLRLEITQMDSMLERDDEARSDSLITNFDETEFEKKIDDERYNVPVDHCTPPATSVMLMNSYFDFIYAKVLLGVKYTVIQKDCYGCLIDHPSQTQHDCIMSDFIRDDEEAIDIYFENMLNEVDEQKILLTWEELMCGLNIPPEVIDLHKRCSLVKTF